MKQKLITILAALGTTVYSAASFATQTQVIYAGSMLAGAEQILEKQRTIVIEDAIITRIEKGYVSVIDLALPDAKIIDLKNQFVMPGLIDMHVHVTFERDANANPHQWLTEYEADYALRSIKYLQRSLDAGFTSVRDLGSSYKVIFPLQRAVERGDIQGPRIFAAGDTITPTGGHADLHGYRKDISDVISGGLGVCDGADDCRRAVREVIKSGADVIKITATGGVLSNTAAGVNQQFTDQELMAIVDTAHNLGRSVTAHAHGTSGIKAALRAGVDSIEHGSYLDKETVKLFKQYNAYLVPTLLAGQTVSQEVLSNPNMPTAIADKVRTVVPNVAASFKLALKNNVNIAFGTDSGVSRHGNNADEFLWLVKYGMTEKQAIMSATVNAAKLLGQQDRLGQLSVGKQADIISVNGSPLDDITTLQNVQFVMKAGQIYKHQL
ncbi:MAG: imidazolonepropionase-like amidohydrolase [Pseudoalteromonas rhizosphaerae]|jgi:imidazolonepropionase-like amidohydrolase|uniref:Amidohydrolase family protein n=1 Tax=Pseudoalteromonas neustonica TaxID=1840331 RepID=A0ABY3FF79_9GAMM|nr:MULTISPECIES: amidohydrolase family protein [Pseudoalteromonas]MBB1294224.1 amidohydrolase family protein [Pseudoalteromonas sp. SR41-4]MBB1300195.1 amidohydrolase family protein [Pseudoalteromonas sp. SR44-8]MBB1408076.1 amidohydrolase family protein [Pseudoalteromonas sp. SG44-17]TVU84307.1 amidohydrolase family protein [Pseudoalteromonas neustonica]|tara:strand:- start:2239 stop:3552 length:1314 start_codon:yes stop_codon:yes gene_type:complete